ncbi:MAG: histidinol dehydrogenase [Symbiobacteriia bacterium]
MLPIIGPGEFKASLTVRQPFGGAEAEASVRGLIDAVRAEGDEALIRLTERFDGVRLPPDRLVISQAEMEAARQQVEPEFLAALRAAKANLELYHRRQAQGSWISPDLAGTWLGQVVRPIDRVGLYIPGGTAPLFSTVLAAGVPARVAGVPDLTCCTPPRRDGSVSPYLLAALAELGVTRAFRLGGVQAVAAMAYGTETVPQVDKIAGPGNAWVTLAKKQVYGDVGIDGLNGPSEIAIIADGMSRPDWVAADLLSQAEHVDGKAYLFTPDAALAEAVRVHVLRQLADLPTRAWAERSLAAAGALVVTRDLEEAAELVSLLAPEHALLQVDDPLTLSTQIRHAGAIFLGRYATETLGDYAIGPSHVLPTGGTARFASALGVEAFQKRTSLIFASAAAFAEVGPVAVRLAGQEGLAAHARAVTIREEGQGHADR